MTSKGRHIYYKARKQSRVYICRKLKTCTVSSFHCVDMWLEGMQIKRQGEGTVYQDV